MPEGQCLQKLVLFFDYISSAYINGLWAAFGFVKAEGGFLVLGALVLGGLLSGGIFFRGFWSGGLMSYTLRFHSDVMQHDCMTHADGMVH